MSTCLFGENWFLPVPFEVVRLQDSKPIAFLSNGFYPRHTLLSKWLRSHLMNNQIQLKISVCSQACLFCHADIVFQRFSDRRKAWEFCWRELDWNKDRKFWHHYQSQRKTAIEFIKEIEQFHFFFLQFGNIKMKKEIPPIKIYAFSKTSIYETFRFLKNSVGIFPHQVLGNFAVVNLSGYRYGSWKLTHAQQLMKHEYVHFAFDKDKVNEADEFAANSLAQQWQAAYQNNAIAGES